MFSLAVVCIVKLLCVVVVTPWHSSSGVVVVVLVVVLVALVLIDIFQAFCDCLLPFCLVGQYNNTDCCCYSNSGHQVGMCLWCGGVFVFVLCPNIHTHPLTLTPTPTLTLTPTHHTTQHNTTHNATKSQFTITQSITITQSQSQSL